MSLPVTDAGKRLLAERGAFTYGPLPSEVCAIEAEMVNRMTYAHKATHPADARPVLIKRLTMAPPGSLVYHAAAHRFERTDCGLRAYHEEGLPGQVRWVNDMVIVRRDTAALIGRPCAKCRFEQ